MIESAGDKLANWLRDDPARAAMLNVVETAVDETVDEIVEGIAPDTAEHLRDSLLVHELGVDSDRIRVTSESELRNALNAWTTALDHPEFGEPGYLSQLRVEPQRLADTLANRIIAGIRIGGRRGGALSLLAEWLWRDDTTVRLVRIEEKVEAAAAPQEPLGGGLPGGTPDFTGRQQALAELASRVKNHDPAGTVVTIHSINGMAGIGKTELAVRAAHQHKHHYPHGQYFINLHGYTDGIPPMLPATALEELLRQAGVPGPAIPTDLAGRQARWQALMAGRRAMVLLDNALDTQQVRPLLPGSAGCLVLITSRSRLAGLSGARALPLDVLPPHEAVELFARLIGAEPAKHQEGVARVVGLVGRLPVAIEAAAGQVHDDLTVTELVNDLTDAVRDERIMEDTGPLGAGVRAALDTSLRRLSQVHRTAFLVLGLIPGPTVGVAQFAAVADQPAGQARSALRALAERNLVKSSRDSVGHHRYELHDLIREFARQQARSHLPQAQRSTAITKLSAWYAAVLTALGHLWEGTDDAPVGCEVEGLNLEGPGAARVWLVAEQDNLLAFAAAATGISAAEVCRRAAQHLHSFGYNTTAEVLFSKAAEIYRQSGNRAEEARARLGLGTVAAVTSNYLGSREHLRVAQCIYEEIADLSGEAGARHWLGEVARAMGDYPSAREHYRAAQVIFRQAGDQDGEADAQRGLGNLSFRAGELVAAREHYHAALALFEQIGDWHGRATVLCGLGWVAKVAGDIDAARESFHAAKAINERHGNPNGEAEAHRGLGNVAESAGDHVAAFEHYRLALAIYERTGNRSGQGAARRGLGRLAVIRGDHKTATEQIRVAVVISEQTGEQRAEAGAHWDLGDVARRTGDYVTAVEHYQFALAILQRTGDWDGEATTRRGLGDVARLTGDYAAAVEHFRAAHAISERTGDRSGEADALHCLGIVAKELGKRSEACEQLQRALRIYEEIRSPSAALVRDLLDQLGGS